MPLTDEAVTGVGASTSQVFERGALVWDVARVFDNPPVSGDALLGHIDKGVVLDFFAPKPAAAPAPVSPAPAPAPAPSADAAALQAQVTSLQGQLSTLHSSLVAVRQVLGPLSAADQQLFDAMTKAGF